MRDNGRVSDAPNRPDPTEPVDPTRPVGPAQPGGPTSVEPAAAPHPKVEHLEFDPETPESAATAEHLETEVTNDAVTVRRAPRYGRFLTLGGILGAIVALILTVAFPDNPEFDKGQVFGFLLLACGAIGVALGALVALLLDRSLAKRAGSAVAEHESTHFAEGDAER